MMAAADFMALALLLGVLYGGLWVFQWRKRRAANTMNDDPETGLPVEPVEDSILKG